MRLLYMMIFCFLISSFNLIPKIGKRQDKNFKCMSRCQGKRYVAGTTFSIFIFDQCSKNFRLDST